MASRCSLRVPDCFAGHHNTNFAAVLQNNIGELFQLLAFLDPAKFGGGIEDVEANFGHLAEQKQVCELLHKSCRLPHETADSYDACSWAHISPKESQA